MGTFELINVLLSTLGGGILTLWSQSRQDLAEERTYRKEVFDKVEDSSKSARGHKAQWKGFYWVRGLIALMVMSAYFIFPLVAVFIDGVQIVVGYYDVSNGFWPWSSSMESIAWVKAGAADAQRVIVFDPIKNNIAISVAGLFFGNQFARRG